jgi:uncharacterized protein (DUF58 family)
MPVPRRLFFIILLTGLVPGVAILFFRGPSVLMSAWYILLAVLSVSDFLLAPAMRSFAISRRHAPRLSIGAENRIEFRIENLLRRKTYCVIRDLYPAEFDAISETMSAEIPGLSEVRRVYHVRPLRKGHFIFTGFHMRVAGPLGLFFRQYSTKLETTVEIYPNLLELGKYLALQAAGRLDQAGYRQRQAGAGMEFSHLREYMPGDDYRRIDWKATARRSAPVTRVSRKEESRNIVVLLDSGRMMTTRYGIMSKLDLAVDASLILAAAAGRNRDSFGLVAFADRIVSFLAPSSGTSRSLTRALSALHAIEPVFKTSDYPLAGGTIRSRIRKNSIIFVFSELSSLTVSADLLAMLKSLARGHKVHFVSFEENEKEPVNGASMLEIVRTAVMRDLVLEKETLIRALSRSGVQTIRVNETNIRQSVVNTYLSL